MIALPAPTEVDAGSLRLANTARERLVRSGYALLEIQCECHEARLVLAGRVHSYYLKQVAQTLALGVPGVDQVVNRIEVAGAARG